MSDILCVTNRKLCREEFLVQVEKIAAAHPAGIILREKDLQESEYIRLAQSVSAICAEHQVPFIWHSFADAALRQKAQAIHLPLSLLRGMTEEQRRRFCVIGASCHSVEDAQEAERLGCTYITAGHIFATDCKKGVPGRGPDFLKRVCACVSLPVFAIGGIGAQNAGAARGAGAKGVCVMSGLMCCADAEAYLQELEAAWEKTDFADT